MQDSPASGTFIRVQVAELDGEAYDDEGFEIEEEVSLMVPDDQESEEAAERPRSPHATASPRLRSPPAALGAEHWAGLHSEDATHAAAGPPGDCDDEETLNTSAQDLSPSAGSAGPKSPLSARSADSVKGLPQEDKAGAAMGLQASCVEVSAEEMPMLMGQLGKKALHRPLLQRKQPPQLHEEDWLAELPRLKSTGTKTVLSVDGSFLEASTTASSSDATVHRRLEEANLELESLRSECMQQREEQQSREKLQEAHDELQARLQKHSDYQAEAKASHVNLETALAAARTELDELRELKDNSGARASRAEKQLQEEKRAVEQLEKTSRALQTELSDAKEEASEAATAKADLKLELTAEQQEAQGFRRAAEEVDGQAAGLEEELKKEVGRNKELRLFGDSLQERLRQAEEDASEAAASSAAELREQLSAATKAASREAEMAKSLAEAQASKAQLLSEVDEMRRAQDEAGDRAARAEQIIESGRGQLREYCQQLSEEAFAAAGTLADELHEERQLREEAEVQGEGLREAGAGLEKDLSVAELRLHMAREAEEQTCRRIGMLESQSAEEGRYLAEVQAESSSLLSEIGERVAFIKRRLDLEIRRGQQLQDEVEVLRDEASGAGAKEAEEASRGAVLRQELDGLRVELREAQQAAADAGRQAATEGGRAALQGRRLEALQAEHADLAKEASARAAALELALEDEEQRCKELRCTAGELSAERQAREGDLATAERGLRTALSCWAQLEERAAEDSKQLERVEGLEAELADQAEEASKSAAASQEGLAAERRRRERLQREASELRGEARAAASQAAQAVATRAALEEDLSASLHELREAREAGAEASHEAASAEGRLAVERQRVGRLRAERSDLAEDTGARVAMLQEVLASEHEAQEQLCSENDALQADRRKAQERASSLEASHVALQADLAALEQRLRSSQKASADANGRTALVEGRLEAQGQHCERLQAECQDLRMSHEAAKGVLVQLQEVQRSHADLEVKLAAAEDAEDMEATRRSLLQRVHEDLQQALRQTEHRALLQAVKLEEEEGRASREQQECTQVRSEYAATQAKLRLAERDQKETEAAAREDEARLANVREALQQEQYLRSFLQLTNEEADARQRDTEEQVSVMESAVFAAQAELASVLDSCQQPSGEVEAQGRSPLGSRLMQRPGSLNDVMDANLTEPAVEPSPATLDGGDAACRSAAAGHAKGGQKDASPQCSWQRFQMGGSSSSNSVATALSAKDAAEVGKRRSAFQAALSDVVSRACKCDDGSRVKLEDRAALEQSSVGKDARTGLVEEWHAERRQLQDQIAQILSEQQAGLREMQRRHEKEQESERSLAERWREEWEAERRLLLTELELHRGITGGGASSSSGVPSRGPHEAIHPAASEQQPCCRSVSQLKALTSHSPGGSGGSPNAHLAAVLGEQKALEMDKVLAPLLARRRVEDFAEAFGGRSPEPPAAGDADRPTQTLLELPAHVAARPSSGVEQHAGTTVEASASAYSRVRSSLRSALALSKGELPRAEMEETLLHRPQPEFRPFASVKERSWAERPSLAERSSWADRPLLPDRPPWGVGPGLRRPRSAGQVRGGWR